MHTFFRSIVYTLFLVVPLLGLIIALVSAYFEVQVIADLLGRFWIALLLVIALELIKVSLILSIAIVDDSLPLFLSRGFRVLQVALLTLSFIASCALLAKAFDRQDDIREREIARIESEFRQDSTQYAQDVGRLLAIMDAELEKERSVRDSRRRFIGTVFSQVEAKRAELIRERNLKLSELRETKGKRVREARSATYPNDREAFSPVMSPLVNLVNEVFGANIRLSTVSFFSGVLLSLVMELAILISLTFFGWTNRKVLQLQFERLRMEVAVPTEPKSSRRQPGHKQTQTATDRQPRPPRPYTIKTIY